MISRAAIKEEKKLKRMKRRVDSYLSKKVCLLLPKRDEKGSFTIGSIVKVQGVSYGGEDYSIHLTLIDDKNHIVNNASCFGVLKIK